MDVKVLNDNGVMIQLLTVDWRVITFSLHTIPEVHGFFIFHKLEWMETLIGSVDMRAKFAKHDPLREVLDRGFMEDISSTSICRFMYSVCIGFMRETLTP